MRRIALLSVALVAVVAVIAVPVTLAASKHRQHRSSQAVAATTTTDTNPGSDDSDNSEARPSAADAKAALAGLHCTIGAAEASAEGSGRVGGALKGIDFILSGSDCGFAAAKLLGVDNAPGLTPEQKQDFRTLDQFLSGAGCTAGVVLFFTGAGSGIGVFLTGLNCADFIGSFVPDAPDIPVLDAVPLDDLKGISDVGPVVIKPSTGTGIAR